MFASLQKASHGNPNYFRNKEAQATLEKILELAPNHLSAKLLLELGKGHLSKTLSVTASNYYTAVSVYQMLSILNERAHSGQARSVPSGALRQGLLNLRKLRPLTDPAVRPLVDAWGRYIEALEGLEQGTESDQAAEASRQALLDQMNKQQMNTDLMQKTIKEGV